MKKTKLTYSAKRCFLTCQRKYWFRYVCRLRPAHESDALRIGAAFHVGLERLKSGASADDAVESVAALYAETPRPPWMNDGDYEVERETACAMVRGWAWRYADEERFEIIWNEKSFEHPLQNPVSFSISRRFSVAGKLDALVKASDGRWFLLEHKTAGQQLNDDYWRKLLVDSQVSQYIAAARRAGYHVAGVIYDVTRKPSISPKSISQADRALATSRADYYGLRLASQCPERETPRMFGARLLADMRDRPDFYFQRRVIGRLDIDIQHFESEQWTLHRQIVECEKRERQFGSSAWPRNTDQCFGFGRCEFFDICVSPTCDPRTEIPDGFRRIDDPNEELS